MALPADDEPPDLVALAVQSRATGNHIHVSLRVPTTVVGATRSIRVLRRERCSACAGSGLQDAFAERLGMGFREAARPDPCPKCTRGFVLREATLAVDLAGVHPGENTIRLEGEGHLCDDGSHGDVVVDVHVGDDSFVGAAGIERAGAVVAIAAADRRAPSGVVVAATAALMLVTIVAVICEIFDGR